MGRHQELNDTASRDFIDIEQATVRGLSSTELVRMITPRKRRGSEIDTKLLRDIGLDRSTC